VLPIFGWLADSDQILQKHNIYKKRLDPTGLILDAPKPDAINQPKIEKPLQKHGGRLEHNETYCGSCFGAETVGSVPCDLLLVDFLKL
jgi:hypothetical protein